ncbi:MAG TPA: hypothetical protein VII69_03100 [Candidatus Eremiobacteraceae bacterium]
MKISRLFLSALAIAIVGYAIPAPANAAPRPACSVLPLADVRAIVAAPVTVYQPGSSNPTVQGDSTYSTCTYSLNKPGMGARVSLMWGPSATLAKMYKFYVQRNKELPQIKGGALVLASVTDTSHHSMEYDTPASKKLLAAAIAKL